MKTKSFVQTLLLSVALAGAPLAYAADPTIQQVYQAAQAGKYVEAQAMMDKVLADHPNSAKAHFVEAELLAKQGKMVAARTEFDQAEKLDPSLGFAKPGAVAELRALLSQSAARPATAVQPYQAAPVIQQQPRSSGGGWGTIFIGFALLALLFFGLRAFFRRQQQTVAYGPGGGGYSPVGGNPGYGPGPGYGPAQGGGLGSSIMGGLATGAAVGAGIAAGEALVHHFTDSGSAHAAPSYSPNDNFQPQDDSSRYDMGGSDFGVSDGGGWDSGGGDSGGVGGDDW